MHLETIGQTIDQPAGDLAEQEIAGRQRSSSPLAALAQQRVKIAKAR